MQTDTQLGADLTAEVDLTPEPHQVDLHDPQVRREVERAVCSVPGVVGARLVPGFEREVDELHVLSTLDKHPKQAVRDVQTVLMARFGITTDHRVISVVQLDERDGLANASRVVIDRVAVTQGGSRATAEVTLRDGDDEHHGQADDASSTSGRHRAIAHATLAAVRPLLADGCVAELEGIEVTSVLGHQVAVALVDFHTGRSELTLSGSALIRDAEADAIARAVLDALNRSIVDSR